MQHDLEHLAGEVRRALVRAGVCTDERAAAPSGRLGGVAVAPHRIDGAVSITWAVHEDLADQALRWAEADVERSPAQVLGEEIQLAMLAAVEKVLTVSGFVVLAKPERYPGAPHLLVVGRVAEVE